MVATGVAQVTSSLPAERVVASCQCPRRGEDAVVDPAEREGLGQYVVTVAGHRQHLTLREDRIRGVGVVAEPGRLRPQHPDQLPVRGGQVDDPDGRGVVGGAAGRRDDLAAAGCDHRGLQARHGDREGGQRCRGQAAAGRRGIEPADPRDLGRVHAIAGVVPPGDHDRAVAGPGRNTRPVPRRTLAGPGPGGAACHVDDLDAAIQRPGGRKLIDPGTARASSRPGTAPRRSPAHPGCRSSAGSAPRAGRPGTRSAGTR